MISLDINQTFTEKFLRAETKQYKRKDDVFRVQFLQGAIFTFQKREIQATVDNLISLGAIALLKSLGCEWIETHAKMGERSLLACGLFVASDEKLFEVYEAYVDKQGACLKALLLGPHWYSMFRSAATTHNHHSRYVPIMLSGDQPGTIIVAVPSRIRNEPTETKPLAGLRIAAKDNFHLKGVQTSLCSRKTYPPQDETAPCIAKLERAGADIVGTVKMAVFAAIEEPLECVDYEAPWNPHGDGNQLAFGSSSGSGVAVASYEWLDIAIGSDSKAQIHIAFFYGSR